MCLRVDGRARPTVQKLVQVCEDRLKGATVTLGEKAYESPPASPAKPPPKPATPPPKPVALPPTPEVSPPKTARDARRLEALLRRRRTHLTNLRAAAALLARATSKLEVTLRAGVRAVLVELGLFFLPTLLALLRGRLGPRRVAHPFFWLLLACATLGAPRRPPPDS